MCVCALRAVYLLPRNNIILTIIIVYFRRECTIYFLLLRVCEDSRTVPRPRMEPGPHWCTDHNINAEPFLWVVVIDYT